MKITENDLDYVAKLANIEVAADERKELADQLTRIVEYVEKLNELDVSAIAPTAQIMTSGRHALRDDRVAARNGSSEAGKSAKLFKVPKVITDR